MGGGCYRRTGGFRLNFSLLLYRPDGHKKTGFYRQGFLLRLAGSSHCKNNELLPVYPSFESCSRLCHRHSKQRCRSAPFQKFSPDIIIVGDIQRVIPCGDFGCNVPRSYTCLCTCLRCAVTVAVILVRKGAQDFFPCSGFRSADVTVPVIGIGSLHPIAVTDMADTVPGIVAVAHFQSVIVVNTAPAS